MSIPQEQFRISIDSFDGPLDLLLYLVKRAEVDICDIPIAQIADDYLEVLRSNSSIDVEMAGEFLVMAASLIELKSRSLVPPEKLEDSSKEEGGTTDSIDPREDLIRQLLSFQRFRVASELLEAKRQVYLNKYSINIMAPALLSEKKEHSLELDDVHSLDLFDAYEYIASSIDFNSLGEHHVSFDDVPIELCQEDLMDRLRRSHSKSITLQEAFSGLDLQRRVGMFLATLELVRLRQVTVVQSTQWGSIEVCALDETVMGDEPLSED